MWLLQAVVEQRLFQAGVVLEAIGPVLSASQAVVVLLLNQNLLLML
jgi:hypothetical protein